MNVNGRDGIGLVAGICAQVHYLCPTATITRHCEMVDDDNFSFGMFVRMAAPTPPAEGLQHLTQLQQHILVNTPTRQTTHRVSPCKVIRFALRCVDRPGILAWATAQFAEVNINLTSVKSFIWTGTGQTCFTPHRSRQYCTLVFELELPDGSDQFRRNLQDSFQNSDFEDLRTFIDDEVRNAVREARRHAAL